MALLTDMNDIIDAMNKELEDAPESVIRKLAKDFNVQINSSLDSNTTQVDEADTKSSR